MAKKNSVQLGGGGLNFGVGGLNFGANALTGAGANLNLTGNNMNVGNTNQNSGIGFTYKTTNNAYKGNYETYNPQYPGFDKNDYEILERMADKSGKTGQAKKDLMDELYLQYYDQVINKHKLDDRSQIIKEQAYSTKDYQGNDKKVQQTKVKLADLSQKAKKKFGIDASVPDNEVINDMANNIPNGGELLEKYINNGDKELLYKAGLEDDTLLNRVGDVATDIVGGAYDSATSLFRMGGKGIASAIGWTAKQLGADEAKVDSLVQSYKDYVDNDFSAKAIGANTDSIAYMATKAVGDLAQVAAGEGLLKGAIQGTAKGAQIANYLKSAPTWQKMIAGGLEGAGDMALYSIVAENKLPTAGEEGIGATIGALIPGAGALYKAGKPIVQKTLGKTASQLQLSGLLNPAKLNTIKNNLINEGTDLAAAGLKGGTAEDVGTWMIERGFKGDKEKIISDLGDYATKSHNLKREVLGASESLHNVDSARKSLEVVRDTIKDVPGLENRLSRVEKLLGKEQHTLSELDEIKSILDDTKDLYTLTGNPKGGAINKGLIKVRQDLRKYIEDAAEKEGLGNVKMLNNETQIAKGLQDGISRKDSADAAREMLSVFSKSAIGGAAGYNVGPFDTNTLEGKIGNVIVGALAGKYLFSTNSKTKLASLINKMSGGSKKELSRLVAGDLEAIKLSNKTKKELESLLKEVEAVESKPTEMTQAEWEALTKKYSTSDLPVLEFKEGIVDDAGKNILAGESEKIAVTPKGNAVREGKINDVNLPQKNPIDDELAKLKPEQHDDYKNFINTKGKEYKEDDITSWFGDKAEDYEAYSKYKKMESEYGKKGDKWTLDYQLKKIKDGTYQKAKVDYDNFLEEAAKETGGIAIKAPLKNVKPNGELNGKGLARVLEKAYKKGNGVDDITDIVRGTIGAKDRKHIEKIIKRAESKGYEVDKGKFTQPTSLGYSDASFIFTAPNGIKAEVQINYPEMIVAKEGKEAIKMGIINEADYNALLNKLGVEGGLGHKYYEEWRALDAGIDNGTIKGEKAIQKAKEDKSKIEKMSQEYYKKFEK